MHSVTNQLLSAMPLSTRGGARSFGSTLLGALAHACAAHSPLKSIRRTPLGFCHYQGGEYVFLKETYEDAVIHMDQQSQHGRE